jgi:hypothetical protein
MNLSLASHCDIAKPIHSNLYFMALWGTYSQLIFFAVGFSFSFYVYIYIYIYHPGECEVLQETVINFDSVSSSVFLRLLYGVT